jgi:hypothetical protein
MEIGKIYTNGTNYALVTGINKGSLKNVYPYLSQIDWCDGDYSEGDYPVSMEEYPRLASSLEIEFYGLYEPPNE